MTEAKLYNSRIVRTYVDYVGRYHQDVDTDGILRDARITRLEINDDGHWFTQSEVDTFQKALRRRIADPDIARKAGRYVAESRTLKPLQRYVLGFLNPVIAYEKLEKLTAQLSRHASVSTKRLSATEVEVSFTPQPGVREKPFQCDNRIGSLEAIALFFTGRYADVKHPHCLHRGDEYCRYIVRWHIAPYFLRKRYARVATVAALVMAPLSAFMLEPISWIASTALLALIAMTLQWWAELAEKRELAERMTLQVESEETMFEQAQRRYNESMLVRDVGEAISQVLDPDDLIDRIMRVIKEHYDYRRGAVFLVNEEKTLLSFKSGYGLTEDEREALGQYTFELSEQRRNILLRRLFVDKYPVYIEDAAQYDEVLNTDFCYIITSMDVDSLLCIPIFYEDKPEGMIVMERKKSMRPIVHSDISLLMGIAPQVGISINNARSYRYVTESEKRYRAVVEDQTELIYRCRPDGTLTFVNEAYCRYFGKSRDDLLGTSIYALLPDDKERIMSAGHISSLSPEHPLIRREERVIDGRGETRLQEWTNRIIIDGSGMAGEVQGVGRDVTQQRDMENQLRVSLREKEVLLKEIHHRVKNNLQIVSSLLNIQSHVEKDNKIRDIITESRNRVLSMAYIHEYLYSSDDMARIDVGAYIRRLVGHLLHTLPEDPGRISHSIVVDNVYLDISQSIPCGLIINELVSNALKHAFPAGRVGTVSISLAQGEGSRVVFEVRDDGIGMPEGVREGHRQNLGLQLVRDLVTQLRGDITVETDRGTRFRVDFPAERQ